MVKQEQRVSTEGFKLEAVRSIETSGRPLAQELEVGLSTSARWKRIYHAAGSSAMPHDDVIQELVQMPSDPLFAKPIWALRALSG